MATAEEVARSYWRAECARDTDAVMEHYREDATFESPGGALHGGAIRSFYEDSSAAFPGLEVDVVKVTGSGSEAALEWQAVLIDHAGTRFALRGVNVVTTDGERFVHVRAYFDPSTLPGGNLGSGPSDA